MLVKNFNSSRSRLAVIGLTACACLILSMSFSYAAFITPKRVMIDDGERTGIVSLNNRGDEVLVYSFSWERRAQDPNGKTVVLKDGETLPGYRPADEYLIFSPRRVIVNPGEAQRVRILARRTKDMAPGEYHSHLKIASAPLKEAEKPKAEGGLSGTLAVRSNVSIPVFLRTGPTKIELDIKTSKLFKRENGNHFVKMVLDNHSTRSAYIKPDLLCYKAGAEQPEETILTTMRLYAETKYYDSELPVPPDFDISGCQTIKLRLIGLQDFEYSRDPIAVLDLK